MPEPQLSPLIFKILLSNLPHHRCDTLCGVFLSNELNKFFFILLDSNRSVLGDVQLVSSFYSLHVSLNVPENGTNLSTNSFRIPINNAFEI